jgi:hypothetical protein
MRSESYAAKAMIVACSEVLAIVCCQRVVKYGNNCLVAVLCRSRRGRAGADGSATPKKRREEHNTSLVIWWLRSWSQDTKDTCEVKILAVPSVDRGEGDEWRPGGLGRE